MIFVRPSFREMDRDNLVARMKSGLDGVADALKINDKLFRKVTASVEPHIKGGYVDLKIEVLYGNEKV